LFSRNWSGVIPSAFERSAASACARSLRIEPGRTLLIVTPRGASSREIVLEKPMTPGRIEFESSRPSIGCRTDVETMLTMRPQPRSIMPGATFWVHWITW